MVNILDKAIKNPDQVQAVCANEKSNERNGKLTSCFIYTLICSTCFTAFLVLLNGTLAQKNNLNSR